MDALLAVVLVAGAILATQTSFFQHQAVSVSALKQAADDALGVMEDTGYLFRQTDSNGLQDSAKSVYHKAKSLIGQNSKFSVKIIQYNLNKENCRQYKDFANCFTLIGSGFYGDNVDSNDIAYGKKLFVKKQSPGDCNVTAQLSQAPFRFNLNQGTLLFEDLNSSDSNVVIQARVSRNGQALSPGSAISCDENLVVDLNASIKSFGRSPADVMLVMDKSGSMSWTGNSNFGNTYSKVWVDRNYAFLTRTSGFHDYNAIGPDLPGYVRLVSSGNLTDVFMQGNYAYFTDSTNDSLKIFDSTSMPNPVLSGSVSGFSNPQAVAVSGNYAYVADSAGGLKIVNVTNKASPTISAQYNSIGNATKASLDSNTLWLYTSSAGTFNTFDTSNSAAQNYNLKPGNFSLDTTYATSQDNTVTIGRSASLSWAGQAIVPYSGSLQNFSLYVRKQGSPSGGLAVSLRSTISGSNLATVTIPNSSVGSSYAWVNASFSSAVSVTPGSTYYLVLTTSGQSNSNYYLWGTSDNNPYPGGTAYQQTGAQSPEDAFLRFTDSEEIAGQGFVPNASTLQNFSLYLKKTGSPSSLNVALRSAIGGADLATATILASSVGTGYAWVNAGFSIPVDVAASGTYYFVLSTGTPSGTNYYFWGASNSNPYSGGQAYLQANPLSGVDAFGRNGISIMPGIQAFDISNAPSISYLSTYSATGVTEIDSDLNYLYVTRGNNGLQIVNYSNMAAPVLDGSLGLADTLNSVFVSEDYAYIAADSNLYKVNVESKAAPFVSMNYRTPYGYNDVFVDRNYGFLATQGAGLITIDLLNGEKINVARNAGRGFVDFSDWKTQDQMGLVSFSSSATTNRQLLGLGDSNKALIKQDVNSLYASGSTAIGDAMHNARTELNSARHNPNALKFQVLMTDGQNNAGTYDPVQEARDANSAGIIIYAVGFGPDADTATLQQIAGITGGKYYYAWDANSLSEFFQLIAIDIGLISAQTGGQSATSLSLSIPVPEGSQIDEASITQTRGTHSLASGLLTFGFGDLNKTSPWYASYSLAYPCNSDFACGSPSKRFPENGTTYSYSVLGNPYSVFLDSNNYLDLNFLYRDLRVSFDSAELEDINRLKIRARLSNIGDLNTIDYPSGLTDLNFLVNSAYSGTSTIKGLCGSRSAACSFWFDFNSADIIGEGDVTVSIDSNKARDCPQGNSATISCRSELITQFYLVEYGAWQ